MPNAALNIFDPVPCIAFEPMPIELLGCDPKLDDEVAGEVLWLDLAPLLAPETAERCLIVAEDDPGVGAADKRAAIGRFQESPHSTLPAISSAARWIAPVRSDARSARMASASVKSSPPGAFRAASSRT